MEGNADPHSRVGMLSRGSPDASLTNGLDQSAFSGTALSADAPTVSPDSARRVRSRDSGRLRIMPIITDCARLILEETRSGKIIWR